MGWEKGTLPFSAGLVCHGKQAVSVYAIVIAGINLTDDYDGAGNRT